MNTRAELDAFFERVPERRARRRRPGVLRVHRPARLPRRGRELLRSAAAACSSCARSRRSTASPGSASATRSGRGDVCAAMAKVRRPFDVTTTAQVGRAREPRRRRRGRAPPRLNAEGLARARAILRRARPRRPPPARSATSSTSTSARTRAPLFERLLREGVIVRPLAGFGAPTAIRVSVGTPDEHAVPRRGARRAVLPRPS